MALRRIEGPATGAARRVDSSAMWCSGPDLSVVELFSSSASTTQYDDTAYYVWMED